MCPNANSTISIVDENGQPVSGERDPRALNRIVKGQRAKRFNVLVHEDQSVAAKARKHIRIILGSRGRLPNGKNKHTCLSPFRARMLEDRLVEAVEKALVLAATGKPLPNNVSGPGSPPDNSILIFIDDIMSAFGEVGLYGGLRYATPESLPVSLFKKLAPELWLVGRKNPRRYFERWQRHRRGLYRQP
jgi:hypothetical protein